jgi:hypothetical protein
VGDDAEVVRHLVEAVFSFLGDGFTHEYQDGVGKLILTWVVLIVGDLVMQNCPKSLDRIKRGAVGRQLDQMDMAS